MEWPKLKNIILLLLVCVNAVLLVLYGMQAGRAARYEEETRQAAVTVLEQNGITFGLERFPDDLELSPLIVTRERDSEAEVARLLLGDGVQREGESDVRHRYTSALGTAEFSMNGSFTIQLQPDAWLKVQDDSYEDASTACLEHIGLSCSLASVRSDDASATLSYVQNWEGAPVFSCQITLVWEENSLLRIEGQRLAGTAVTGEGAPLSTATILVRFLAGISQGGYVCSRIDDMIPGYVMTGSSRPAELTPVWCVVTDSGAYYVDAITGELTPADAS